MHGLAKMKDYIWEFGSTVNFYEGPGEALHKMFMKTPGQKMQQRVKEFCTQTAGQYYNVMALNKAVKYLDLSSKETETMINDWFKNHGDVHDKHYSVQGQFTGQYLDEGRWKTISRNKDLVKHGLDTTFLSVLERLREGEGRNSVVDGTCSSNLLCARL